MKKHHVQNGYWQKRNADEDAESSYNRRILQEIYILPVTVQDL